MSIRFFHQKITYLILLLFTFSAFIYSCRKIGVGKEPEINYEKKFFTVPAGTHPTVLRVINKIKEQNDKYHFVNDFVKKHGLPKWEYADVKPKAKSKRSIYQSGDNTADTLVFIPIANEVMLKIKDVLACDVNAMDVAIQMITDYTYKYYGYEINPDGKANAADIAKMFMNYEYKVYQKKIFEITDVELAKKLLGDDWENKLSYLIIKEDPITQDVGFYSAREVVVPVPTPSLPGPVVVGPINPEIPTSFFEPPTIGPVTLPWWFDPNGVYIEGSGGNFDEENNNPEDTTHTEEPPNSNTNPPSTTPPAPPGTPSSGGSGGTNGSDEPGWEEPECGGYWQGEDFIRTICDDATDANGYYYSRIIDLNNLLGQNPWALTPCTEINKLAEYGNMHQSVASVQTPQWILDKINNLNESYRILTNGSTYFTPFEIQTLQNATGNIVNNDFFPVQIKQLPPGFTASGLLEYFRLHINDFTSDLATFEPLRIDIPNNPIGNPFIDETSLYNSPYQGSVGTLIHIDMADDGTIVESEYNQNFAINHESHNFTFTTMKSPLDFDHPVAGNRRMGIYNYTGSDPLRQGELTFYTMGVDRISDPTFEFINWLGSGDGTIFNGADSLWKLMQSNMITFINGNGGQAEIYRDLPELKARPNWNDVKDFLMKKIDMAELKRRLGC